MGSLLLLLLLVVPRGGGGGGGGAARACWMPLLKPMRMDPPTHLPPPQISATKEGVKFTTTGDVGTANITLRCVARRACCVDGGLLCDLCVLRLSQPEFKSIHHPPPISLLAVWPHAPKRTVLNGIPPTHTGTARRLRSQRSRPPLS